MQLQPWGPGLSGLIYLPSTASHPADKNRPCYIAEVDQAGQCKVREGPMIWHEARARVQQLAIQEGKIAFSAPEGKRLQSFRSQGYLNFNRADKAIMQRTGIPEEAQAPTQKRIPDKSSEIPVPQNVLKAVGDLPLPEIFDALFDIWADEALLAAGFPAEKPKQGNRIPIIVKRKVAQLCGMKICFPDSKPACFRMADSKGGKGGPYNRFSYFSSIKTILPNWEYLVQIAAFRDLIVEYGYSPDWMKFEYKEFEPVAIYVDIGIKIPSGPKIFVEVKETKTQWEILISQVKGISIQGVDLTGPDRGNDPLRKAKYIIAGHPDFFVGYSPEGFDSYKVIYEPKGQFSLQPAPIPNARINPSSSVENRRRSADEVGKIAFMNGLLGFLQEGFLNPLKTFQYLMSRGKCSECISRCNDVLSNFSQPKKTGNPWRREGTFFNWCKDWYNRTYEEPVRAVFVNSLIAQFLASANGLREEEIARCFRIEFRGEGAKGFKTPACIWKDRESVQITGMACDFLLLLPLPITVGEVKVAMPHQPISSNITQFREDLATCEEWLKSKTTEYIQKFGIERFEYGLAILIDLTDGQDLRNLWKSSIDEEDYLRRGIFARLISPRDIAETTIRPGIQKIQTNPERRHSDMERPVKSTVIKTKDSSGKNRYCDATCYESRTHRSTCKCICGGHNHGVGYKRALEYAKKMGY